MTTAFMICAVVGATVMVLQFMMTVMGLGGHGDGDMGGDVGHDFGGGDAHGGGGDGHGADHGHGADQQNGHHGSAWLFSVISFRTLVAALAFFGLAGLAADAGGASPLVTLLIALGAGWAAMYGVYWMMRLLYSLKAEGTARIDRCVGLIGTVYLRIPPAGQGHGKIQINQQNRTMEYLAQSGGPEILTGTTVEVVGVLTPDTVEVLPCGEVPLPSTTA